MPPCPALGQPRKTLFRPPHCYILAAKTCLVFCFGVVHGTVQVVTHHRSVIGLTPGSSEDAEVTQENERSSLLARKPSLQSRGRISGAFSRAHSTQSDFARQKSGSPLRSSRTGSAALASDIA